MSQLMPYFNLLNRIHFKLQLTDHYNNILLNGQLYDQLCHTWTRDLTDFKT
jgi:hypothetical protein